MPLAYPVRSEYGGLATHMTDAISIALIVAVPTTITSVATLIVAVKSAQKVEEVHRATNSMKDALVAAALIEGHAKGVQDEKSRKDTKDANIAEGVQKEKDHFKQM